MTASPPNDKLIKCISTHGGIRGVAVTATQLARDLAAAHGISGFAAQALGETAIGALLIASFCKGGEHVNVNIRGTGKIQQALVDATPDGDVRGYVIAREGAIVTPIDRDGLVGPWGDGLLAVLRTKRSEQEQPYIGTVPLLTGHLAKDFTFYWVQSEQIPSAVGLAVNLDEKGDIESAGGFLVQALPGATPLEVDLMEKHIQEITSYAENVAQNPDPLETLSQIFQDTAFVVLEEKPIRFQCSCAWERVQRALTLTGADELRAMAEQEGGAEVRCDFCAKVYRVDQATLRSMADAISS